MTPEPDGVDRLLLTEALPYAGRRTIVLDDVTGALTLGLPEVSGVCCDSLVDRRAVLAAAQEAGREVAAYEWVGPELLADAGLVVARLPKSLAALDELAQAVAAYAGPHVTLLSAGRVKHMTRGMNDVLARHFAQVHATLGQHKARGLVATGPHPGRSSYPRSERHDDLDLTVRAHDDLDLTVCAHGAVFAGTGVDVGSRLLIGLFDRLPAAARAVVDLGSGSGVLAVAAARALPQAALLAVDVSAAAVRSTAATAEANDLGGRIEVEQADGLDGVPAGSVDLVVCNPPFHRGTAWDTQTGPRLFGQAGRALRPGGELWVVWNSALPYLPALRKRVGSTSVVTQTPRFTVTRSVRPG